MSNDRGIITKLKKLLAGHQPAVAPARDNDVQPTPLPPPRPSFDYSDERIPSTSRARIETIRGLLSQIEDQAQKAGAGGDALELAQRIVHVYVPDLLESYFAIPPDHRAEIFRRTGQSASFQINQRLETMIDQLRGISASFAAGQIDDFTVNLQFIDQRFKQGGPF